MFAGKSSELLGTVRKYKAVGWPVLVITHSIDKRYSEVPAIVSHDADHLPAMALQNLVLSFQTQDYKDAKLVIIEEAQFFSGLTLAVIKMVEEHKKDVI